MMCDHHAQARVQLEQEKAFGNDAEKEDAHPEARVPAPPVSPEPPGVTTAGNDAANISNHTRKNRPKQRKDEKDSCGNLDKPFYTSEVSDHAAKNLSNLTGGVKTQRGKSETNGNYVQGPRNPQEGCSEEAVKPAKKRRPVTVDSAKAKTSLEALKLSIKQLKWKEVR